MLRCLLFFALILGAYAPLSFAIIGGERANGSLPEIINLRIFKDSRPVSLCTGTIVGSKTILTAAHCLVNSKLNVFETDGRRVELDYGEGRAGILAYAIPSSFKKTKEELDRLLSQNLARSHGRIRDELLRTAKTDLALIYTREKIQLPSLRVSDLDPDLNKLVSLAGFGTIEEDGRFVFPNELYIGKNRISKIEEGSLILRSVEGGASTMSGDSGGPLLNENNEIIGILSGGGPFAGTRESFYVDLSFWRDWLRSRMR